MSRNYMSGAAKRKKEAAELERLAKHPKLSSFFQSQKAQSSLQSDIVETQDTLKSSCSSTDAIVCDKDEQLVSLQVDSLPVESSDIVISPTVEKIPQGVSSAGYPTDAALWSPITEELRSYWIRRGPASCQHKESDFSTTQRVYGTGDKLQRRCLTDSCFRRELRNGESVCREWLLYSPSQKSVYCFVCRLFSTTTMGHQSALCTTGFNDWKNAMTRLSEHENGEGHRKCMLIYTERVREAGHIDIQLMKHLKVEQQYWRNVLQRVVAVVKFLASRGLSFRGDNQILGSQHNGNYLGSLELISKFDPFLSEHLKRYGNAGKGNPSYLSATICEEFIALMGTKVVCSILSELRQAKYFSLSVDSTPDVSHTDQLTLTVRYVKDLSSVERFLGFVCIRGHGAEYLADTIVNFLDENNISIADCRGQSYDNASNMSGQYSGVQARIKGINELAVYVPCAGHSLNLVGVKAVECCTQVIAYFDFLQKLYAFFVASTHRWHVLETSLGHEHKVVKRLSDTRWSAHADAVKALCHGYKEVQAALDRIARDKDQPRDASYEAAALSKKMDKLEIAFLTILWNDILGRFNETSKTLQKADMDLSIAVNLIQSLKLYVDALRDNNYFEEYERRAKTQTHNAEYYDSQRRVTKRNMRITFLEGPAIDTVMDASTKFRIQTYLPIIDSLITELNKRGEAYEEISSRFTFLIKLDHLNVEQITEYSEKLAKFYPQDLDQHELISECVHLKHYMSVSFAKTSVPSMSVIYAMIKNDNLESTFPNVEIAIRMFLSMMVTNCTGERSFSKLKLIKNELRSRMMQERLNCLSVMSIESDVLESLNFDDIIRDFAESKTQKRCL